MAHSNIAVFGSMLYVADGGNSRVQIFDISVPAAPVYSATLGTAGESGDDINHFNHPVGVAVDANYIYVADRNNHRVQVFNQASHVYVATIGTGQGTGNDQFNNPTDVAIDSAGNLYVADFANCRVQQFNSSRMYQHTYGVTDVPYITDAFHYNSPSGVAVSTDGSIYLTENNGQRLIKLNAAGVPLWTVGVAGVKGDFFETTKDNLNNPSDVALEASGRVYVADQWHGRVQIFNSDGSYYATLGLGTGNYEFSDPVGLTIAANGYIYVADAWRNRVQVFDASRNYVATLGVTDVSGSDTAHFNGPQDVAVDSSGQIYVAESNNHRVQVFDASRVYLRTMGVTGECNGSFDHFCNPVRLIIDASNRLYVADQWNNRVQVFDKNGAYLTTLGGAWGSLSSQFRNPQGLAVDTAGNLYVADSQNHRIQKFAPGVPGWKQKNLNGFGEPANRITSLGSFGGQLYASTFNRGGNGAQIWRSPDGQNWSSVMADGFVDSNNVGIDHLIEFNGQLYAGTWNETSTAPYYTNGGQIWRSPTGNSGDWSKVVDNGFSDPTNGEVMRMAVFKNQIYAGTWSYTSSHGAEIWRSPSGDSGNWTPVVINGLNDTTNVAVTTMEIFNGYLYAGIYSDDIAAKRPAGCEIWRTDGVTWAKVVTDGFGDLNCYNLSLAAFGDSLYAGTGTYNPDTKTYPGGQVWRCTAASGCDEAGDWSLVTATANGFGNPQNREITSLLSFGNQLFAVTLNPSTGLEVWRTSDGNNWGQVGFAGFGDANNSWTYWDNSTTVFNTSLFIGTGNWANGGEIWQLLNQIYLPLVIKR
jgi:DNA-binding beta-propeller fold protein YncE